MTRISRGAVLTWLATLSLLGTLLLWNVPAGAADLATGAAVGPVAAAGSPDLTAGEEAAASGSLEVAQVGLPEAPSGTPFVLRVRSLIGLLFLTFLAWVLSVDRRSVAWRVVLWGLGLQLLFALFILRTPFGASLFQTFNDVIVALLGFTVEGARFLFGDLVDNTVPVGLGEPGGPTFDPQPGQVAHTGAFFAFNVLPTIIFFSSLMTVLYHLGVMQLLVKGIAIVMQRTMRTSGAETLSAAGNIFVGQTEAPLLIKPFVERMTMSELHAVMTGGFATVAGGVMAAYVGMLIAYFDGIAGHLMAASVMSAPAALVVAKLMYPEDAEPETAGSLEVSVERPDANVVGAAARGASEGLFLALNVGAMLMAFLALVYLVNAILGVIGGWIGFGALTLEWILGKIFVFFAWIMGVAASDAATVGSLMGVKMVLTEFVAYLRLADILGDPSLPPLQERSVLIATYALSGFANFSSIAIQLGGIGGLAPSRKDDLARLGMRAMIAGTLAAFMTAAVAGMIA